MADDKKNMWFRESGSATNLTSAEAEVMRIVWDKGGPVTVRDVYEAMRERKQVAYTTVMSIMGILAKKGFLSQDKSSTAYVYTATMSDTEVAGSILDSVVDKILDGATEPMISRLFGSKKKLTAEELERLEDLLRKKK